MKHAALIITMQYCDRQTLAAHEAGPHGCSTAVHTGRTLQQQALRGGAAPLPPGPTCWTHAVAVTETQTQSCLRAALCPQARGIAPIEAGARFFCHCEGNTAK